MRDLAFYARGILYRDGIEGGVEEEVKPTLLIILITSFILIAGCTAPLSIINNDRPLSNEVVNITTSYAVGGIHNIELPRAGSYSIHAETIARGYSATIGYQYSTNPPNDRFGNTNKLITSGWTSLTTSNGYLGYSNENYIVDTTFTIPPDAIDSTIVVFCKSNENTVAIIQSCQTKISIRRTE